MPVIAYITANLGSLIALLAYPLVLEARLSTDQQDIAWAVGYAAYVALLALCAWTVWRSRDATNEAAGQPEAVASEAPPKDSSESTI